MAIIDVAQWEMAPGVFARKFPNDELNTKSQLIVREGQEAILLNNGVAVGPFGPGRHTLDTSIYPVLNSLIKVATGGDSPFTAEVWFISTAFKLDIKWGTSSAIQLEDPKYHIMLPVRAFGSYGLTVTDTTKFLLKMIGQIPAFSEKILADYFKGIIITRSKDMIAKYLVEKKVSILQISAHLNDISHSLETQICEEIAEYGMRIVNFNVNSISTDEKDEVVISLRKALATKAEMDIIGYTYQEKRSFDTMETAAGNEGNGGVMNAGMGLGIGVAMGAPMGNIMGGMMNNINTAQQNKQCKFCGQHMPSSSVFCPSCGKSDTADELITCSNCGKTFSKNVKFCPYCGDVYNKCPQCGFDNDENANVCIKCGKKLISAKCPKCNAEVADGMKFCGECGAMLIRKCPSCGTEAANGMKFCGVCGTKID